MRLRKILNTICVVLVRCRMRLSRCLIAWEWNQALSCTTTSGDKHFRYTEVYKAKSKAAGFRRLYFFVLREFCYRQQGGLVHSYLIFPLWKPVFHPFFLWMSVLHRESVTFNPAVIHRLKLAFDVCFTVKFGRYSFVRLEIFPEDREV